MVIAFGKNIGHDNTMRNVVTRPQSANYYQVAEVEDLPSLRNTINAELCKPDTHR